MSYAYSNGPALQAFNYARKWFTLLSLGTSPLLFFINAPFGRFSPKSDSLFVVDGRKAWIVMEIVSPIAFIYSLKSAFLNQSNPGLPSISSPRGILAALYLIHYANRAIISPLRTPSRSKQHIIVSLSAIFFNILNGSLMGSYLSSPFTLIWLQSPEFTQRVQFKVGLALWAAGFVGNIVHDEILLELRRKAKTTGKSREQNNGERKEEYYGIPYGLLYRYISYPNYFCEWIEWIGFALCAGPLPFQPSSLSLSTIIALFSPVQLFSTIKNVINEPAANFAPSLSPPWIFVLSEIVLMLPRAYKGHLWYKSKFGDSYPRERKAVVPFVL
ncbi:hypothetical protein AGABI2DRAFT_224531 [Agaricus bisporus var. bisporus H97]|uniref:hypothetical protein n=1 Tax=Agaricus bisporus var. bisporus (strain H97 / ATCC MYA-4626 / FGSC 10389) TaxID=936046 RepID=UPI00029F5AF8|nr:hypothetical protein AGABI2DRAFT_224531 [Agaricus bisporus var. bisporus H97]EKV46053.1 hypothetical protein AGABI2DRAFT_224531 [Agaricus bisporus var. bisporus H97]